MKTFTVALTASALASTALGHATFQQLWVDGEDQADACVRAPVRRVPDLPPARSGRGLALYGISIGIAE